MLPRASLCLLVFFGLMALPAGAQSLLEWPGLASGPFAVGFRTATSTDPTRTIASPTDYLGRPRPDYGQRPLHIAVWYPADSREGGSPMTYGDYLPLLAWVGGSDPQGAAERQAAELAYIQAVTPQASPPDQACVDRLAGRPVWARRDARPAPGRFPVLIYAPGAGYPAFDNSAMFEYLASHGHIVVAAASIGADGGRMTYDAIGLEAQIRDLEFLVGYVQSLPEADPERIGTAGFSSGGLASVLLALRNARVRALISLDGTVRHAGFLEIARTFIGFDPRRLRIPTLVVMPEPERARPGFGDESFLEQARYAEITRAVVPGTDHHDFASMSNLLRRCAQPDAARNWKDATGGYAAICQLVRRFLELHLGEPPADGQAGVLADETPCRVTVRPAQQAPPSPADFMEVLHADGPARAAEIIRAVAKEQPEALASFESIINQAGYELLGAGRGADAVTILVLNVEIFPESLNASDSLGEACLAAGDLDGAERSYLDVKSKLERTDGLSPEAKSQYAANADRALAEIAKRRAR
jgi:dienelactone hydrolase